MIIATHSGPFHADDVLACAILALAGVEGQIVRTRDPKRIADASIVIDVGNVYDPENGRFDHHQKGGAGERPNGVRYSSAGLVWRHYGPKICEGNQALMDLVDSSFIVPVDTLDNGQCDRSLRTRDGVSLGSDLVTWSDSISAFNPAWDEAQDFDASFLRAVERAKEDLSLQIRYQRSILASRTILMEAIDRSLEGGRVVVLDRFAPILQDLVESSKEALFLVFPQGNDWLIQCVPPTPGSFEQRLSLPEAWAGLRGTDLAAVTGVQDSVFCHNGRFIGGAGSREGAIALARLAIA